MHKSTTYNRKRHPVHVVCPQVVHNDIKTKNVLLNKDATVAKLSDVGTSRILEQTCTTSSALMGYTFAYAAPEQLLGARDTCTEKVRCCCLH